jgi:hypothetical protein
MGNEIKPSDGQQQNKLDPFWCGKNRINNIILLFHFFYVCIHELSKIHKFVLLI